MVKRKFSDELLTVDAHLQHQAKRHFAELSVHTSTMDVDMDASEPLKTTDSSPAHSVAALPPAAQGNISYPAFDLYPLPSYAMDCDTAAPTQPVTPVDDVKGVGLMQPTHVAGSSSNPNASMAHVGGSVHGPHCTQIPKLRMSCSAGLYGRRTMWTHCEQCGAIEMVE